MIILHDDVLNLILTNFASRGDVFQIQIQDECKMYAMDSLEFDEYLKSCEARGYIKAVRCLGGLMRIYTTQHLREAFKD